MSLVFTIDIGNGKTDIVKMTQNTDLNVLIKRFCGKHQLALDSEQALRNEISKNWKNSFNSSKKIERLEESILSTTFTNPEKTQNESDWKIPNFANSGVKIYEKGLRHLEILSQKLERFRQRRKEKEDRDLTFSPKINRSNHRSSVEFLQRSGMKTEEKLEKMRGEKLNNELNQCTFSPQITRKSLELTERRCFSPDKNSLDSRKSSTRMWVLFRINLKKACVFEELYQEAKVFKENRRKSICEM